MAARSNIVLRSQPRADSSERSGNPGGRTEQKSSLTWVCIGSTVQFIATLRSRWLQIQLYRPKQMPVYVLFCNYCATILQRQNELSIHAPGGAPLMSRRAYLERLIGRAPDLTERAPSAAISVRTTSATGRRASRSSSPGPPVRWP